MTFPKQKNQWQDPARIMLCVVLFGSFSLAQATIPITIAATDAVQAFAGTRDVKFLFVSTNDSNVYFVDYSEADPSLKLLEGMKGANLVDISPDGRWLTYQTGKPIEGYCANACTTSLWIRPFAAVGASVRIAQNGYVPRFVVSAVDTPTITYSTAVDCPRDSFPPLIRRSEQLCFKSGMVLRQKTLGGTVVGAIDTIFKGGSYYGGISYDGRYLSTGWPLGVTTFMLDLTNSSTGPQLMHRVPVIDTAGQTSYSTIGGCNISRSPSRIFTNTMLYYDIGLPVSEISNPLWGNWAAHSLLFITRMGTSWGEQLRCYGLPPDQVVIEATATALGQCVATEWYNPEWSNHPYFATASLMVTRLWKPAGAEIYERKDLNEAVYAIGLKDRKVMRLITSTDTSYQSTFGAEHPALWVKIPNGFSEDPGWLAVPDPEKSVPVALSVQPNTGGFDRISVMNSKIVSGSPIAGVAIFSAAGSLLWNAGLKGLAPTVIHLPVLRSGVYFVRVRSSDARTRALAYVVE